MRDEVVILKCEALRGLLARLEALGPWEPEMDLLRQEAFLYNMIRLAQQSVDLANYLIRLGALAIPKTSGESFEILVRSRRLPEGALEPLVRAVGLRNLVLQDYAPWDPQQVGTLAKTLPGAVGQLMEAALQGS